MKPSVDNAPPKSSQLKHLMTNRKKKEIEFQRYSEIERENYRLLDKMSKIMVRNAADSVFGVHSNINCPALDGEKARTRKTRTLLEQNQVMLRRILQTKPYYSSVEWDRHTEKTDSLMGHMCRYPVRLAKSSHRPESTTMLADQSTLSEASHGSKAWGSAAGRKQLGGHGDSRAGGLRRAGERGGAVSAPPLGAAAGGEVDKSYADDEFESEEAAAHAGKQVETVEEVAEVAEEGVEGEADASSYADESFEADAS